MQRTVCNPPMFGRHTLGLAISTILLAICEPALALADGLVAVDGPAGIALVDNQMSAPVIAIVAPNAQGLSHNRWQDYNVGTAGVVLNNSLESGQTQVGGLDIAVGANAQFTDRAASTILNEVVGTGGSTVFGEQVIFGQAADYVLSNPNGIVLNGARLALDQSHTATYVVGTLELENGRLHRYDTRAGQQRLVVGQGGVDGGAGSVQLIAPSVQANGNITAGGDLSVLMGRQQVDAQTLATDATTSVAGTVDANLLGAMQARRINIVSTQNGTGVNMGVTRLHAEQGIEIASAGALAISSSATQDGQHAQARIDAGSAKVKLSATGDMTLTSLAVTAGLIDARAGGRLTLDALSNETRTLRQATTDDRWFTLAPGESNAQVEERTLRHVGNSLVSSGGVRLDAAGGIQMAATRIEGPEFVGMYTVRQGLHAGAKVDSKWRTVRLDSSDAAGDSASLYVERAQLSHINGGSIDLPTGKLVGARIDGAHSVSIGGLGETDISRLNLIRTATQGSGLRRVSLTDSRAHEAYREDGHLQNSQIRARSGSLSIGGEGIRISGAKLSAAKVNIDSRGDLVIEGAQQSIRLDGARPKADQALRSFDRTSEVNLASLVTASDTLSLRARGSRFREGTITLAGSHLAARNALNIDAHRNLWVNGMAQKEGFKLSGSQWGPVAGEPQQSPWSSVGFRASQARSTIGAGSLYLAAGGMLDVAGSTLDSKGDIKLEASDIQLTGSLEPTGPRNRAVWLDNDLPAYYFAPAGDDADARVTDRVHNGFSMKAGGDIDISATRLATHAASVTATGQLTLPGTLALFKDTPVQDDDATRRYYHGYIAPRQSNWQALAGLSLAALDSAVPASNGTTRESSFVAGGVGADTAQRIKDLNIPLTLR